MGCHASLLEFLAIANARPWTWSTFTVGLCSLMWNLTSSPNISCLCGRSPEIMAQQAFWEIHSCLCGRSRLAMRDNNETGIHSCLCGRSLSRETSNLLIVLNLDEKHWKNLIFLPFHNQLFFLPKTTSFT